MSTWHSCLLIERQSLVGLRSVRPGPEFLSCSQQMSACGVGRAAPLVRNRDLYPDFNISLPSQLVWSSDISWTKPLRQSLWRRERKSYKYNWQISLHGKTVPTFCDCWPGSGLGRVIPMGQAALQSSCAGSPAMWKPRQDDTCHLGSLPRASPPVPAHTLGSRRTRPEVLPGHARCQPRGRS